MNIKEFISKEIKDLENQSEIIEKKPKDILMSILFEDNHIHHVIPEKEIFEILTEDLDNHRNHNSRNYNHSNNKEVPKKIIFHNRQCIGDILTMTCLIRDFKKEFPNTQIGVKTTASHIWDNNPYIDFSLTEEELILKVGPGFLTNKSNRWNLHMCNAFRIDTENKLDLHIPQGNIYPDIWLSEKEYNSKPLISGPYWVIIVGGEPGWTSKMYPIEKWQKVIDSLPEIQFVQLGLKNHPYPHLKNVIDFIGKTEDPKTGIRDLFKIFLHAQGSVGLVSAHMHLSAAFNNPCCVVAGAREPQWFTQYAGHQYLSTNGTLKCAELNSCWKCKIDGCLNQKNKIPKCVDIIEPEEVIEAIRKYYKGGRLEYGIKVENKFFKNIIPDSKIHINKSFDNKKIDKPQIEMFGYTFGGSSITNEDWIFIEGIITKYNIRNVLEFGCGLSTLLMMNKVDKIKSFETKDEYINKVKKLVNKKVEIFKWGGKVINQELEDFDFSFIDGPANGINREFSTKIASEKSKFIIMHDAGREWEQKWQDKYLKNGEYELISKGGHRCHLWRKKNISYKINNIKPIVRMITTCRGFGGSERSSIEIMKMLIDKNYHIELLPTGNICGEYLKNLEGLRDNLSVIDWMDLKNNSELTVLYCSDTIWNYNQEQYSNMYNLNTKKKVMILNYQLGWAGKTEWTKNWDKYIFLNREKEHEFLNRIPKANTQVLAPPVDLDPFFKVKIDYSGSLKLVRHSSQGDAKYKKDFNEIVKHIIKIKDDVEFSFMPAPSFIDSSFFNDKSYNDIYRFNIYKRNEISVPKFLSKGNCFWYNLPEGYSDAGPRVILEAMACGLPCICDNAFGAKERVTNSTGWRCNEIEDYYEIIRMIINPKILKEKGENAKERAFSEFRKENWVEGGII